MFGAPGTRLQRLPGPMKAWTPTELQYASATTSAGSTLTATFPRPPRPGNLLVAFLTGGMGGGDFTYPSGFTKVDGVVGSAQNNLALAIRRAQVGDSASMSVVPRGTTMAIAYLEFADARCDLGETLIQNNGLSATTPQTISAAQMPQQESATGLLYVVENMFSIPTTIAPATGFTMRSAVPTDNGLYIFKRTKPVVPNDPTPWNNAAYSVTGQGTNGILGTIHVRGVVR